MASDWTSEVIAPTDEELLIATDAARRAAHDAPLAKIYEVNKDGKPTGVKHISEHTTAWCDRGREYVVLAEEVRRRGLKQLPLRQPSDCNPATLSKAEGT